MNTRRRLTAVLAATAAALGLHGAIGLALSRGGLATDGARWSPPVAVSVRMLVAEAGQTEAPTVGSEDATDRRPPTARPPRRTSSSTRAAAVALPQPAVRVEPQPVAQGEPRPATSMRSGGDGASGEVRGGAAGAPTAPAFGSPAPPDQPTAGAQADLPIYPTELPPAAVLRYALRRGEAIGTAVLSWQPDTERAGYRLQLEGRLDGAPLLDQVSTGSFDDAGVAPVRFTDRRPRSGTRAVNFQRERGIVSFSGPSRVHGLGAGMQDRLSWLVQLAGIVAADPLRAAVGAETRLLVAGPRGDVDSWVFVGAGAHSGAGEPAPRALLFVREPRKPYDLRIEVWLDPSRHHLPTRLRLGTWPAESGLELLHQPDATAR